MSAANFVPDTSISGGETIVLKNITRRYGNFTAIDHLSLNVEAGEFISFLGPSGSGKSTTLMMIAGFETPDSGSIAIGGRDVTSVPPYRRDIGMVFQNYALFPHLTVAENVGFSLKQRGVPKSEIANQVRRALDLVRLAEYGTRYPQQLSGGQQQRIAIARAVIFNPPVLLMDEPLSALDKQLREEMQLEIKHLHQRLGITFVYVTHDQREALVMSDRVAVMDRGKVEQLATPADLYGAPANRFVASFVGEANFIAVDTVEAAPGGRWVARLQDAVLHAASGNPADKVCMVRPEKIMLTPAGMPAPAANALDATVQEVVFMGEATRCVLKLAAGGQTIIAKRTQRADMPPLHPGQRLRASWLPDDTCVF
jgi:putative spermidine/putrescine transport system ATP-binding protein